MSLKKTDANLSSLILQGILNLNVILECMSLFSVVLLMELLGIAPLLSQLYKLIYYLVLVKVNSN